MSKSENSNRGLYIGFTGLDGAGKSTQASVLAQRLRSLGAQCYVCEPKDDLVAQAAIAFAKRKGLSHREYYGTFAFELAKAFAAVRHHYSVVAPMLAAGVTVIDPRTNNCRLALAVAHSCLSVEKLKEVYDLVEQHDILINIQVLPEVAYQRVLTRNTDTESLEDLRKFSESLEQLTPSTAVCVDGDQDQSAVAQIIFESIERLMKVR